MEKLVAESSTADWMAANPRSASHNQGTGGLIISHLLSSNGKSSEVPGLCPQKMVESRKNNTSASSWFQPVLNMRVVLNSFTRKRTSSLKKKIYFRQTFAISMFNFSGTSGEYGTGPRTNEPP